MAKSTGLISEILAYIRRGQSSTVEIEPGKILMIRLLTIGDAHPDASRTIFFELKGQPVKFVSAITR